MSRHLTEQNVVQVWLLAQSINCTHLMTEAEKFCTRNITNFHAFTKSEDFLQVFEFLLINPKFKNMHLKPPFQIPLEFLIKILEKDQFNVKNEEQVLELVQTWIRAKPEENRQNFMPRILDVIRLENLSIKCLLDLEKFEAG